MKKDDFKCEHCGKCCRPIVVLSEKDIERIKELGYDESHFVEEDHFDQEKKALRQVENKCTFLDFDQFGRSFCEIYKNRPDICRKYPFLGCNEVETCHPNNMFEKALDEARELLNKRGFI